MVQASADGGSKRSISLPDGHLDARFGHDLQFVVAHRLDPGLQVPDGGVNLVIPEAADGLVEAQLIVAHAGAAVGETVGAEFIAECQAALDDQVPVGAQQRVFAQHPGMAPDERNDELVPDFLRRVDFMVLVRPQLQRPLPDRVAAGRPHAAGVDECRVYLVALFRQVEDTVAGVEAA
jgi:hypothetical protein